MWWHNLGLLITPGYVRIVFVLQRFSTLVWTVYCGVQITDLDIADDAVIFADTTEVLSEALVSLSEEA